MRPLTGEQRYWQAVMKARLIAQRNVRLFCEGKVQWIPGLDERAAIIAEFDRVLRLPSSSGEKSNG